MKIGWYTHHVVKTPENLSEGQEWVFSGMFAGGAEMTDYEYQQQAPSGIEIEIITPNTFNTHDIHQFDSVVVTGTDLFTDHQLLELSKNDPFVFVHHLQAPRESLKSLIDNSRLFVTHTPEHLRRELSWTNPRKTSQVLSYFDTSKCHDHFDKKSVALWAARTHPLKGQLKSHAWALENDLQFFPLTNVDRSVVLDAMARSEWFVHLPLAFESECRAVMEAVLSGCKIHTNDNVGITSVKNWNNAEVLRQMIDDSGTTFWEMVQQ